MMRVESAIACPVEQQDGQLHLPGRPQRPRHVAQRERPAHVRDALPVERPARLLVVVRDREVPEDGWPGHTAISADVTRWRRYISAAQWDARRPAKASRQRATGAGSGPGGA